MEKLVSIVLPVYNGDKYLEKSIESVLSQTYENWELLIMDDCSTDKSADIAKYYSNKDKRIKYFKNATNIKLPNNLNKGFECSRGDYLTWTSDDNVFLPNAIKTMVETLNNNLSCQFVFASCYVINANGDKTDFFSVDNSSIEKIIAINTIGACFMYTRKVLNEIGGYNDECQLVEDFDYWQRIISKYNVVAIPEALYCYRMHDQSLTSRKNNILFFSNLEKILIKNKKSFNHLSLNQKYLLYRELNRCRIELNKKNPYRFIYYLYCIEEFFFIKIPNKFKSMIKETGIK